jgi:hypothetical protein
VKKAFRLAGRVADLKRRLFECRIKKERRDEGADRKIVLYLQHVTANSAILVFFHGLTY